MIQKWCFKVYMNNLTNFDLSTQKSKKLFNGLLVPKIYNGEAKKYGGVIFHDMEDCCKI